VKLQGREVLVEFKKRLYDIGEYVGKKLGEWTIFGDNLCRE